MQTILMMLVKLTLLVSTWIAIQLWKQLKI